MESWLRGRASYMRQLGAGAGICRKRCNLLLLVAFGLLVRPTVDRDPAALFTPDLHVVIRHGESVMRSGRVVGVFTGNLVSGDARTGPHDASLHPLELWLDRYDRCVSRSSIVISATPLALKIVPIVAPCESDLRIDETRPPAMSDISFSPRSSISPISEPLVERKFEFCEPCSIKCHVVSLLITQACQDSCLQAILPPPMRLAAILLPFSTNLLRMSRSPTMQTRTVGVSLSGTLSPGSHRTTHSRLVLRQAEQAERSLDIQPWLPPCPVPDQQTLPSSCKMKTTMLQVRT